MPCFFAKLIVPYHDFSAHILSLSTGPILDTTIPYPPSFFENFHLFSCFRQKKTRRRFSQFCDGPITNFNNVIEQFTSSSKYFHKNGSGTLTKLPDFIKHE